MASGSRDENATFGGFDVDPTEEGVPEAPQATRFRVDDEVARGGLGRVHRGHDLHLDREVAIKTLLHDHGDAHARFARETRLTARLQHPNIVPVYDGGNDPDGRPYLAMRLVHGRSLAEAIEAAPDAEARRELLPHVIAACHAVAYAHGQRIAHRDLKPDNILVGAHGETVVIDWGLAKLLDEPEEATVDLGDGFTLKSSDSLTRVGSVVGTPAYMPPEQAGGQPVDERADVYALGAVLYHVLAGSRPYAESDDAVQTVLHSPPRPLRELDPRLPTDLVAVVDKAMARAPSHRYPDAGALADELARFLAGRPVHAHVYTASEQVQRFIARHPAPVGLGTLLVVGGLLAALLVTRATHEANAQRAEAALAHDEVAALERAQKERLDALTLERARSLVDEDPGRALTLLAGLSDDVPFDGAVRTIAAAAWATRPPTPLEAPVDAPPTGLTWGPTGPAVIWGDQLALYDHDLSLRRSLPLGSAARHIEALPDGLLACSSAGIVWVDTDDRPRRIEERPCNALSEANHGGVTAALETGHLLWIHDGQAYPLDTPPIDAVDLVITRSGKRTLAMSLDRQLTIVHHDSGTELRFQLPYDTYAMLPSSRDERVFLLGGTTPLIELSWDPTSGAVRQRALPVDAEWLEYGAIPPGAALVVGGSEEAVWRLDPTEGDVRERIALRGAPKKLLVRNDEHLAFATDRGQIGVLDALRGDVAELAIGDQPVLDLAWSPDGSFLVASDRAGVAVHAVRRREGGFLTRVEGEIHDLVADGQTVVVAGANGAWRVDGDKQVETFTTRPTHRVVRCGDQWWMAHDDGLSTWPGGDDLPLPGYPTTMACTEGHFAVGLTTAEVHLYDAVSARLVERRPSTLEAGPTAIETRADGRLLFADDVPAQQAVGGAREPVMAIRGVRAIGEWRGQAIAATGNGTVWSEHRATPLGQLPRIPTRIVADDGHLVAGDSTGGLTVWRDPDEPPARLDGHRQYIQSLALHPDGRWLASAAWDRQAWLWDLSVWPPEGRRLSSLGGAVMAVAWSPDGRTLYTGDARGAVRRWTDPLASDPAVLRRQVRAMAEAVADGRLLPDADALRAMEASAVTP